MRDQKLANRILKNYFSCIRKVGVLIKKQESSWTGKWDSTFVVLTNAGFIYFESESLKEEKDLKPRNFKPLNDFVVTPVPQSVSLTFKFVSVIKKIFELSSLIKRIIVNKLKRHFHRFCIKPGHVLHKS